VLATEVPYRDLSGTDANPCLLTLSLAGGSAGCWARCRSSWLIGRSGAAAADTRRSPSQGTSGCKMMPGDRALQPVNQRSSCPRQHMDGLLVSTSSGEADENYGHRCPRRARGASAPVPAK
jgi:hypothetical protein